MTDIYVCLNDKEYISDFSDGSNHKAMVAYLLKHLGNKHRVFRLTDFSEGTAWEIEKS